MQLDGNVEVNGIATNTITNAGSSRIYGAELELTVKPMQQWTINFSGGYLNAEFKDYCADIGRAGLPGVALCAKPNFPNATDNTDLVLRRTPKFSGRLSSTYDIDVGSVGTVSVTGTYKFSSSQFSDLPNFQFQKRGPTNLFEGDITWRSMDDKYRVAFFVQNLTNEKEINTVSPTTPANIAYYNAPRTYGVSIAAKF
jgi:iron complex outermembrane recepter protein